MPAHLNDLLPAHVACASAGSTTAGAADGAPVKMVLCRRSVEGAPAVSIYRRRTAWCAGSGHLSPARSHRRARGAPEMGILGSPAVGLFLVVHSSQLVQNRAASPPRRSNPRPLHPPLHPLFPPSSPTTRGNADRRCRAPLPPPSSNGHATVQCRWAAALIAHGRRP